MDTKNESGQTMDLDNMNNNVSEITDKESQLQREIEELDEALEELAIDRKILQDRQDDSKQQIEVLKKKLKNQKNILFYQNTLSSCAVLLRIVITGFLGIFLLFFILFITTDDSILLNEKQAILSDYYVKNETLKESIKDLKQQRNRLLEERLQSQSNQPESNQQNVISTILTEQNRDELEDYIAALRRYPTNRVEQKTYKDISYYHVVQKYDMEDGYLLSDAGNASIYPGAVLRGDSLMQGNPDYALIGLNRTPMTLTCSIGGNSVQLKDISYGTVTQAVEQLWSRSNSDYSQKWEYSVHSTQDEEGLKLNLGISAGKASTNLGVSHTDKTSTIAITFTETYFSIIAEPLSGSTQYFQDGCDLKNLGEYEPAYVSSVDYGRRMVVLVSTELSEDELNAKLGANIKGVDISADIAYIKKHIDKNCKILVYGGDSAKNLQLIDNQKSGGIKGWWNNLINGESDTLNDVNNAIAEDDSLVNPVPLTYHLNYLSDNSSVPAVAVLEDAIILAENAKLVTITLKGNDTVPGLFRLDNSVSTIGCVLNKNWIRISEKGKISGEIQLIWDSSRSASLKGYFNNNLNSYSLTELSTETNNKYTLATGFLQKTDIQIYISDTVYKID